MKIKVENLSKRFNREWIFKDLSFQFSPKNNYAIVGPNGSGKSTLLQILWGQLLPSHGNLLYETSGSVLPQEEVFKHISIATPYMDLIDEFTLLEMIRFHFKFKRVRKNLSIAELLELFELTQAKDKPVANFSSGMRQRLKLGLAFYSEGSALFLDEPTTNLDKKSIAWYWHQLNNLPKEILVIIASNQEQEYPQTAEKIDILKYK
jgi:ABC-type multidrug transport system ATPase subunit